MAFLDDLLAAQETRDREYQEYLDAQATLNNLTALRVGDGIDVSEHNGDVDWQAVRNTGGAGFAFVRVSDGNRRDLLYSTARVNAVRAAGLPWGPYHYCRPAAPINNERSGRVEAGMAIYFAQEHGWGRGDLPMALDVERDPGANLFNGQTPAKTANHVVEWVKAYSFIAGHRPIIYTNPSSWGLIAPSLGAGSRELLLECPLWVAHYETSSPTIPAPWTSWAWWQFTSAGSIAGVTATAVDLNKFSGSITDLNALRIT